MSQQQTGHDRLRDDQPPVPRRHRTGGLALALAALVALGALPAPAAARSVAEIKASGKLVLLTYLGANETFVRKKPDGTYDGIDYDLVAGYARTIGVQLQVVVKPRFPELIPALQAGEGDVVACTLSITPEREKVVDFTAPYFPVSAMLVVRRGSPLSGVAAFADKVVAAPPGTTLETRARAESFGSVVAMPGGENAALAALRRGEVDAVLLESSFVLPLLKRDKELEVAATLPGSEQYGIAVPQGSDLKGSLDNFLAGMKKGRSYYQLVLRYLGERGVELLKRDEGRQAAR